MLAWWRRRQAARERVEADARDLVAGFGDLAYGEARRRSREADSGLVVDQDRPRGHWQKVRMEVARLTGHEIGVATATRYLDRG